MTGLGTSARRAAEPVYATTGYGQSVVDLAGTSRATDMVFRHGVSLQTPSMTGNVEHGDVSSLAIGVSGAV